MYFEPILKQKKNFLNTVCFDHWFWGGAIDFYLQTLLICFNGTEFETSNHEIEINAAAFNRINNAQEKITHWFAENDCILM